MLCFLLVCYIFLYFLCLLDTYTFENQTATCRQIARNVRSRSLEERHDVGKLRAGCDADVVDTAVKNCGVVRESYCTNVLQSQSPEDHDVGEFSSRYITDRSRSLSCPSDETYVKTISTASASDNVCFQRNTQQTYSGRHSPGRGRTVGISEQTGTPTPQFTAGQLNVNVRSGHGADTLSAGEYDSSVVEADGLEPEVVSPQQSRLGASLSQTSASPANDSGYVDQDGVLSSSMQSVRLSGSSTVSVHRRPVENNSGPVKLRNYQEELSEPGCQCSNCIICAPTGSGKTLTAGYICRTRRELAVAAGRRFKCLFVVCIRNLITQQRDALCRIMPDSGVVCGMDDKLMLSEYFQQYDVVVATAQVCEEI